jgi:hypothetical protein
MSDTHNKEIGPRYELSLGRILITVAKVTKLTASRIEEAQRTIEGNLMPHEDLPPQRSNKSNEQSRGNLMAHEDLPPQKVALYAAGGGFGGALLAIVIAKILAGPCCYPCEAPQDQRERSTAVSALFESDVVTRRVQPT